MRKRLISQALAPWAAAAAIAGAVLTLFFTAPSHAGPGHSGDEGHAHEAAASSSTQSPRIIATSETYQLVGILKEGKLTIYLDREADNSPVKDARIEVSHGDLSIVADKNADETYSISAAEFSNAGEYDLNFSIADGDKADLLGAVLIVPGAQSDHGGEHTTSLLSLMDQKNPVFWIAVSLLAIVFASVVTAALFRRKGALPVIFIMLGAATILDAGVARAGPGHSGDEGHAHGPEVVQDASDYPRRLPDGSVFFPKPTQRIVAVRTRILQTETLRRTIRMPGRIIANPSKTSVVHAAVEGRLEPHGAQFVRVGQTVKAGDILAYVKPTLAAIDRSDVEQTAGQLDQEIALAENRVEQFRKFTTFPAERVRTAEIELKALKRRRESLTVRQAGAETLVAPIDGEVIASHGSVSQLVSPRDTLFKIVNTSNLWIEALSYDNLDIASLGKVYAEISGVNQQPVNFIGRSTALEQQASIIHFELTEKVDAAIGRAVSVFAEAGDPMSGLVIPRKAIVQSPNGQFVVFKHVEPERFEPKFVRFVEIDSTRALITAGVEPGEKIVLEGASLINQVR
jgi:multidrug efflux pump subunit AcrA (membrane-fusion protein)